MNNKKSGRFSAFLKIAVLFSGRLFTVAGMAFLTGYAINYVQNSSYGSGRFPVAQIEYQGLEHVDRESLDKLVRRSIPANLLQVELTHVQRIVESEPWVKTAHVRRVLPDRLIVRLTERQAAAVATIDGELYIVDQEGAVLDRYGARYQSLDGPIVKGLRNLAEENAKDHNLLGMRTYLQVLAELRGSPKDLLSNISEINIENPDRVALIPSEDPIPVYVGSTRFLPRYESFLSNRALYEQLKRQYGAIEYVDATFDSKIIFHTPSTPPGSGGHSSTVRAASPGRNGL